MQEGGYKIGGEQSGHIILKKYATTGDGILTAIMLCEEMCDRKATLAELTRPLVLLPQKMKNIRVSDKARVARDPDILAAVREIAEEIGEDGRILLRESGTEPVIRIMVEAKSEELCDGYIERARSTIEKKGYIQK